MLKLEDFIRQFPIIKKTDRDCEAPVLIEWLQDKQFESVLDIGCHSSLTDVGYAKEVRKHTKLYDGIDINFDPEINEILNNYFVGNANEHPNFIKYDAVICVSTIEHAGLSTYKGNNEEEKMKLFETCLRLSKKYIWISFPVGQEYVYPDQLSVITDKQLKRFETLTSNFKVKQRFFYNQGPQAGHPWYEHTKREIAVKIPYIDFIGNQSICVLEVEKI